MALTTAQLQALKADILADPAFASVPNTNDGAFAIADAYNLAADPAFYVWRSHVSTYDIRSVLVWAEYDALTVSRQNAFQFLCSNGRVDARLANVRQGISSIFTGPGQAGNLAALTAAAKRTATRAEKLFAGGEGTQGTPSTSPFDDGFRLTYQDVYTARNLA